MKILYIVHQFYPAHHAGTEKFLLNLSTMMQKWGHTVKVATYAFSPSRPLAGEPPTVGFREYQYKGVNVVAVEESSPPDDIHHGVGHPGLAHLADLLLRAERPDIVHVAHAMRMSEFVLAAERHGIPYVVTMTDFFLMCPRCTLITERRSICHGPEGGAVCAVHCPSYPSGVLAHRLERARLILEKASRVIAPSHFLGALFCKEFPSISPRVIPYGIDFSRIVVNRRKYAAGGEFVILYAGQLDVHKGVHVLISAVRRIASDRLVLKLYGTGPRGSVEQLKKMAHGDARIKFCGTYTEDEIGAVFSAVDLVAIPSNWHENNTIVMREAIASHVPCVVSDAGGMVEKIRHGVNGFVFPMGDSNALQSILEDLLRSPERLAAVKRALITTSLATVEQEAYAYLDEYRRIAPMRELAAHPETGSKT